MDKLNKYPCCICKDECRSNSIECSVCDSWIHSKCVPMTTDELTQWSDNDWNFVCKNCAFTDTRRRNGEESFDFMYALNRIMGLPGITIVEQQERAKEIQLLMSTYKVKSLPVSTIVSGQTDLVTKRLLQLYSPITLEKYNPIQTIGDGNCLYRAVSRLLYGTESHHIELRLRTTIEILLHPEYYDKDSDNYRNQIQDVFVVTSGYQDLILAASKYSSYAELLHIYALSAAVGVVLQSFFPPTDLSNNYSKAFTRKVTGRCTRPLPTGDPVVMWTQTFVPARASNFKPNHFVPLQLYSTHTVQVSSDDNSDSDDDALHELLYEHPFRYDNDCHDRESEAVSIDNSGHLSDETMESNSHSTGEADSQNLVEDVNCKIEGPAMGYLPNSHFMTAKDVLTLLTESSESLSSIPYGHKHDAFFVFNNEENADRRARGQRSHFWDDCGAWTSSSGSSPKSYFINNGLSWISVHQRNGLFCKEARVKGKRTFVPLDPQPDAESVIVLQRSYATLKDCPSYRRRISWLESLPSQCPIKLRHLGLAEYQGQFPGRKSHGNAKSTTIPYMRSKPELLAEIEQLVEHHGPRNTYDKMHHRTDDPSLHPRSMEQVKNVRKRVQAKKVAAEDVCKGNFADNVVNLCAMVENHPFIQSVLVSKAKVPSVVCYTAEQIRDIRRFCAQPNGEIWGFDKTFNLGDVFVTTSVYKNTAVKLRQTGDHPIFLGPVFLHGNSDFETYSSFFSKLACSFTDEELSHIVIGTDDESALRKAIRRNFNPGYNTVCTRHLKNNTKDFLTRNVPSSMTTRKDIISSIFGENGMTSSEDDDVLDYRVQAALTNWTDEVPSFVSYFQTRLLPIIKENVYVPQQVRDVTNNWTNNNCESINHVLKVKTDWKQLKLTELVLKIYEHVDAKFKDLKKAIYNEGSFCLTDQFSHHQVSADVWFQKTPEGRNSAFQKFMSDIKGRKTSGNRVTTQNGGLTVPIKPSRSKKLNQVKRSRAEKTSTRKKQKIQ